MPYGYPLTSSQTITDDSDTAIKVNSITLHTSESGSTSAMVSSSTPQTPYPMPTSLTEDEVLSIFEDPLNRFNGTLFTIPEESPSVLNDIIPPSNNPVVRLPSVNDKSTPGFSTPNGTIAPTGTPSTVPTKEVTSLRLIDEDFEGSIVDIDISMMEGEVSSN
jgi:hypothetical protein